LTLPGWRASSEPERFLARRFESPFAAEDFAPRHLAVDESGRLYLADSERVTIARYSSGGPPDFAFRPFAEKVLRAQAWGPVSL
jgi:hypothetical protein